MGLVIDFQDFLKTRNATDTVMKKSPEKLKTHVEASIFQAEAVWKSIEVGKSLTSNDVELIASALYEISHDWHESGRLSHAEQAKALSGKGWTKSDSTKRLYKYTLPPGNSAAREKRRKHLVKKASAYKRAVEALSKAAQEDVHVLTARIFRGTTLVGELEVNQADDHLIRTAKLMRALAHAVARDEKLNEYFQLLFRYPLHYDFERQRFDHSGTNRMERGPAFDRMSQHIEDAAPVPSCLLIREYFGSKTLGSLRMFNKPIPQSAFDDAAAFDGAGSIVRAHLDSSAPESIIVSGTARLCREVRLCVSPWQDESRFEPSLEHRIALSVEVSEQDKRGLSQFIQESERQFSELKAIRWAGVEPMNLYSISAHGEFSGIYSAFCPDEGAAWPETTLGWEAEEPWYLWFREVTPKRLEELLSCDIRSLRTDSFPAAYVPSDHVQLERVDGKRALTTWPPQTAGALIEQDLLTCPAEGIEARLRESARALTAAIEPAVKVARARIDGAAEAALKRWSKAP